MRILRNYILKDFFSAFTFSILSLSMVMLLGNVMKVGDMIIRQGVNPMDALKVFFFVIPYLLSFIIPFSFLLGVLLAMGRLIADNEIVAITSAGVSPLKILSIFIMLGVIFSLCLFILNDQLIPNSHLFYRQQLGKIYSKNINVLIEPGVFMENFSNFVIYASDKNENKLINVYIYQADEKTNTNEVTVAKEARFTVEGNTLKMLLEEGFKDKFSGKTHNELSRLNFKSLSMDIPLEEGKTRVNKKPSDMELKELKKEINGFKSMGVKVPELEAEFNKRISLSFSVAIFAMLAFGVSLTVKHREKSINFGIAFIAAGVYYLLFIVMMSLVEHQKIHASLGMWLPNALTAAIGAALIYKNAYSR